MSLTNTTLRVASLSLLATAWACGPMASGNAGTTTSSSGGGSGANGFIAADLDGTNKRATELAGGRAAQQGHLQITAATATLNPEVTYILTLPNSVGTHTCGAPQSVTSLTINRPQGSTPVYFDSEGPNGACTITVTQAAANVGDTIIGTFSGVASQESAGEIQVTNGTFEIKRTQ
ncbi:MAG: hypothetical protein AB2A00_00405 [Myxococcota bacterium]